MITSFFNVSTPAEPTSPSSAHQIHAELCTTPTATVATELCVTPPATVAAEPPSYYEVFRQKAEDAEAVREVLADIFERIANMPDERLEASAAVCVCLCV